MNVLPVNLDDLIHARAVESVRREFKASWDQNILHAVIRTLCAFANDLQGLNGGYIVLGIEDRGGEPVLPPVGIVGLDLERVQQEIRGNCRRIDPEYQPVLAPEVYMGKPILVIWAPAGDVRPYQAPQSERGARQHYVRLGSETVEAKGEILNQLLGLSARVPFDERRRLDVPLSVISQPLVEKFLRDVQSAHAATIGTDLPGALRSLRLSARNNGGESPRNVALLFFTDDPDIYLPGAKIEVAHFRDDAGGDVIETWSFQGPIHHQVRQVLKHLESLMGEVTRKVSGRAEAERFVAFPFEAMEEAIVNAVFHRGYDLPYQAARIGLYPDRMEITSFPGPVPGLEPQHIGPGVRTPQLPTRNPRVGDLLKALRLAETWHTGIPKMYRRMRENGSPPPTFDFDVGRTYFRVTLPAHPGYLVFHALREAAGLWHGGDKDRALGHIREALARTPTSGALTAQLIEFATAVGDLALARQALQDLEKQAAPTELHLAITALVRALLDRNQTPEAMALLERVSLPSSGADAVELAILFKRSGQFEEAHRLFTQVSTEIQSDPRALHEFAQVKTRLAKELRPNRPQDKDAKRRFNREAAELLRRVTALAVDQPTRAAWAWFDLARTLAQLGEPESVVRSTCETAIALQPQEERFKEWLTRRANAKGK